MKSVCIFNVVNTLRKNPIIHDGGHEEVGVTGFSVCFGRFSLID